MKIKLMNVTIKDLTRGYKNNFDEGVLGFDGILNIRPKYQREFVYKEKQRNDVIFSILKNFPLNVMYWTKNKDGTYELLDGQQRTISICDYVKGDFSLNNRFFHNLQESEKNKILDYKLNIYICEGDDKEKLDWFKIINIAGEKLTEQELRNAIYTGEWLNDAKKYFSKKNCPAYNIANEYMKGASIRQDYLETAIKWISERKIEKYMSQNQNKPNANELWLYFQNVINWIKITFPKYRREMKGVDFGFLFNEFKDKNLNSKTIENEINNLMIDDDVTKKSGIYMYVLTRKESYLNIRSFTNKQRREAYERQKGICPKCKEYFEIEDMEADHITPWRDGGKTISENCQLLCKHDNRIKSSK